MNRRRRETIIREIEYWKRSRLLPEQYCDYLLALYTEGDGRPRSRQRPGSLAAGLCLLLPAAALAIYFTELSFVLQTLLLSLFLSVCLLLVWRWRKERQLLHFPLIGSAWLLLMGTVAGSSYYFPGQSGALTVAVLANCAAWLAVGHLFRLHYFSLAAAVGGVLTAVIVWWQ
ncbi:membrane protein [Geobacillus genomosp. 3]|uniref:Membrane protein n=1 Tax=Geobacillus genomosp. 3 TaxID=1921421 RepID=S5ZET3_GEOG3|nr:membrane protein [Geobacillus genomosp. 3]AGT32820.1 membrane protein [Geobacillus genomosp. 3]